jgi:3-hexulose-6-phosphate synthase
MTSKPIIQLALDYVEMAPALAMAQLVAKEVEALEIGTPLTKAAGMLAVRTVRHICPDNIILADVKTPDVGGLEAKICFDAGANWMTVLGAAPLDTVRLAYEEAQRRDGHDMFIELTGVRDIIARASEWRDIGVDRLVYHRGWDEGNVSRIWGDSDLDTIGQLIDKGFQVSVAGGLTLDMVKLFKDVNVSVIVVGRAIREAADPIAAAKAFREEINKYWG